MRPEVTSRAMAIVNRLFDGLHLHNKALDIADVELFGSNASFEYDEMADLSIHVFLNTARNPASYTEDVNDLERFMKLFTDTIDLEQKGEVNFYGIPVTIAFHATRPPGFRDTDGQPQYSIWSSDASRTGRWINPKNPPPAPPKDAFDIGAIITKSQDFSSQYNALATAYFKDKQGFDCKQFGALNKILKAYRTDGIAEDGQRSDGNLTYRLLRRLSVDVPDTLQALDRECRNIKDSLF
jgi:predicted nucleotidyltransferase